MSQPFSCGHEKISMGLGFIKWYGSTHVIIFVLREDQRKRDHAISRRASEKFDSPFDCTWLYPPLFFSGRPLVLFFKGRGDKSVILSHQSSLEHRPKKAPGNWHLLYTVLLNSGLGLGKTLSSFTTLCHGIWKNLDSPSVYKPWDWAKLRPSSHVQVVALGKSLNPYPTL